MVPDVNPKIALPTSNKGSSSKDSFIPKIFRNREENKEKRSSPNLITVKIADTTIAVSIYPNQNLINSSK